jgi:hypothetical protein
MGKLPHHYFVTLLGRMQLGGKRSQIVDSSQGGELVAEQPVGAWAELVARQTCQRMAGCTCWVQLLLPHSLASGGPDDSGVVAPDEPDGGGGEH